MTQQIKDCIEDAQHRLLQAMHELETAKELASKLWDGDATYELIDKERRAISNIDDTLGDIKSGRN